MELILVTKNAVRGNGKTQFIARLRKCELQQKRFDESFKVNSHGDSTYYVYVILCPVRGNSLNTSSF